MIKLNLVEPTDPVLNLVAEPVAEAEIGSVYVRFVIDRMLVLAASKGRTKRDTRQMLGLAAPQLGVSKAIIMMDVASRGLNEPQDLKVFLNPKIVYRSQETVPGREGCWSTGNICGNVQRSREVVLEAVDRYGKPVRHEFQDFTARLAQHECDHLEGVRFPDRITDKDCLHWVEHDEFDEYREHWRDWPKKCPRARWEALKSGLQSG